MKLFLLSTAILCSLAPASAAVYYVSPTGSDSNSGSSTAPFQTIQQAANVVNPGDTVIVRDGTYSNSALAGEGTKLIQINRGGTSSAWVTFAAEHTWGAVIDGLSNTTAEAWSFAANYVRVQGFEVKGFSDDAFTNYSGGQYIDIVGNHIHDIGRYCTTTGIGRDGIFLGSDNVTVEQNLIHDVGRYAPGENGCVNSLYYQTNDHGIYVAGANNVTIRNNIIYLIQHGWSVHVYPSAVDNLSVLNNTFALPNPWEPGYIILSAPVTNSRIDNNIFYQPNTVGVHVYNTSGYSNLAIANNMTYQGTISDATLSGMNFSGNKDNTNPNLASPSTYDFHLTSGSPAIDTGLTLADVPNDYAGVSRPQGAGYDIGAYEYAGSVVVVSQPADLTISKTHSGNFTQGQAGATYTITVKNAGGGSTSGTVGVTDTLPAGLSASGLSGTGWSCTVSTLICTRGDALAAGASYPAITLTVNVASNAPASVTNTATVSGGGETNLANDTATDPTSIAAAVVSSPSPSGGATYYVSTTGSDSNPGTSTAPFLTIQQAANVVNPGDTVIVRDGTYSNPAASGVGSKLINMSRGGTSSAWVTFAADHTWGAVIDGLSNTTAEGWTFAANYIRVQGFEVRGFSDDAFSNYSGGQFIDIVGNHIHDIGRYCTTTGIGRDGIFLSSDNVTVEQNVIHDIGRYAPGENGCTNSLYYQTNDHAIYVASNNVTIKNNILYRNQRGWSVHVYPNAISNLAILNNTFAFPNPWEPGHIIVSEPVTNGRIENNIFYQPNTVGIYFYNTSGYSNLSVSNNVTYQGTISDSTPLGVAISGNMDNMDPMLMSPSTFNFQLSSASPAIDKGMTLADVPKDYAGVSRPQGNAYDIGAFEFVGTPTHISSGAPDLSISKTHSGSFTQGQTGATYTITVTNSGTAATAGTVGVTDTLPTGLTASAIGGTGWNCSLTSMSCTRSDALAAGGSYPAITVTVNVSATAPSSVTNTASVSGGGDANSSNNTASDPTTVSAVHRGRKKF